MPHPQNLGRPLAKRVAALDAPAPPPASPPTPIHVMDAAAAALARGETHYTDRPGIPEFRGWVADHLHARWGLDIDPAEVTITCGSAEARYVALTLLTEPGGSALCLEDESRIRGALQLLDGRVVREPDADTRLLYLRPDDDRAAVNYWLNRAETNDWWILWDMSFAAADDFHPARRDGLAGRVVSIDSLSGALPGWRLGWMAGSAAALRLRAGKQAITICTTAVSQWAGLAWLQQGGGRVTTNVKIPQEVRDLAADGTQLRYALMEMARDMDDVITLGRGDPDLPTPAHIVAAAVQAMRDGKTDITPVAGMPALREEIAEHLRAA